MTLKGKAVIVTGGARGLGPVFSTAVSAAGAKVVVCDIRDGEETVEGIRAAGGEGIFIQADVSDEDSVSALVNRAHETYGRIDGLVNNAARVFDLNWAEFNEITTDDWDAVMAVNVKGPWLVSRAVYPYMKEQGSGKIVNLASGVPFKGLPAPAHYTVSKGAVVTLTRVLARSMGKDGICVNAVGPGLTRSESLAATRGQKFEEAETLQIPTRAIPRGEMPEDLVGAMLFFLSDGADFITGQTLLVDGGSYMN